MYQISFRSVKNAGMLCAVLWLVMALSLMYPAGAWAQDAIPDEYLSDAPSPSQVPAVLAEGDSSQEIPTSTEGSVPAIHSQDEIRSFVLQHDFNITAPVQYARNPVSPTEPGALAAQTQTEALNALNAVRYIAGVPAAVTLDNSYEQLVQAASLVSYANFRIDHFPQRPDGMPEEVYALGSTGCAQSNLAAGYINPAHSLFGYMDDSDSSNIRTVGHRRWCLNPSMQKTAFGQTGYFSAMYAFDGTYGANGYVAWPAAQMPTAFFGANQAWSLSSGSPLGTSITVVLTRMADGKVWNFSTAGESDGDLYISHDGYGGMPAVIFRPKGIEEYKAGDVFHVAITDEDTGASFDYDVEFFNLFVPDTITAQQLIPDGSAPVEADSTFEVEYGAGASSFAAQVLPNVELSSGMETLYLSDVDPSLFSWISSNADVATVGSISTQSNEISATITPGTVGESTITIAYGETALFSFTYKVNPAPLSAATISGISNATYTGAPIVQSPVVTKGSVTLSEGVDYSVAYKNNTNAGTATVTFTGHGNYTGEVSETFAINPASVEQANVSGLIDVTYTGRPITQKPVVKMGTKTLVEGTDYTYTIRNNTLVGNATVTITGQGNYTGSKNASFRIKPISISQASITGLSNKTFAGNPILQVPVVRLNGTVLTEGTDYTYRIANNDRIGTATVSITGIGNYAGTKGATFKINAPSKIWYRLAGNTKFDTMRHFAVNGWADNSGGTVIIATAFTYQDALSAASVAGKFNAPILVTDYNKLTSQTKAELDRLRPSNIIIVGGEYVVTPAVKNALQNLSYVKRVDRVAGKKASDTAAAVARTYFPKGTTNTAILATSQDFRDALSASPIAYVKGYPIFLVDSYKSISDNTLSAMRDCGITNVVIVGGKWMVDPVTIEAKLAANGITSIDRKAGNHYWDTSYFIARWGLELGLSANRMGVATGYDYSDALCGAPFCGKNNAILVLTEHNRARNTSIPRAYANRISRAFIFGGTYVVEPAVMAAFEQTTG